MSDITYTVDDLRIEFFPEDIPVEPEPGDHRLSTFDDKDVAHGEWGRDGEEFARGDQALYDLWHLKSAYEKHEGTDEEFQDTYGLDEDEFDAFLRQVSPHRVEIAGPVQGTYSIAYFPADTSDTEKDRETVARLLANYSFGNIYAAVVTFPDGETDRLGDFDDAGTVNSETDVFLSGTATDDQLRDMLIRHGVL